MPKPRDRGERPLQAFDVGSSESLPHLPDHDLRASRAFLLDLTAVLTTLAGVPTLDEGVSPNRVMRTLLLVQRIIISLDDRTAHSEVLAEAALVGFRGSGPLKSTSAAHGIIELAEGSLVALSLIAGRGGKPRLRRSREPKHIAIAHRGLRTHFPSVLAWLTDTLAPINWSDLRTRVGCELLRISRRRKVPAPLLTNEEFKGAEYARLVLDESGALKRAAAYLLLALLELEQMHPGEAQKQASIQRRAGVSLGTVKKFTPALRHLGLIAIRGKSGLLLTDDGRNEALVFKQGGAASKGL